MKLNNIDEVRIYFLSEFSVCCHPKILLPWQRDVTASPLYGQRRVCAATFSLMKFAAQLKSCKIASWRFLFHTAIGNILKMGAGIVGAKKASY